MGGKVILEHPDKPKFLEGNVKRIQEGWDDTKKKASDRLKLLVDTKEAWVGYAQNNETIAAEFEVAEEEIKKVKKRYALDDAVSDLKKRQDLFNKSNTTISGLFKAINDNFTCMSITLPEDKKKLVGKEIAAVEVKLEVVGRFKETVAVIEKFVADLTAFDNSLKAIDGWKDAATAELKDIKEASGAMLPEDRVARTMDLQEDIASKSAVLADLNEVKALHEKVSTFDKTCLTYAKVLDAANGAAQKMTTHAEADAEVAALKERYNKVKAVY